MSLFLLLQSAAQAADQMPDLTQGQKQQFQRKHR